MRYLFEHYALDTDRWELRHGADLVAVEPQVLDVLTYLIRNRDRVVSRDDLLVAVWKGRINMALRKPPHKPDLALRVCAARAVQGRPNPR